MEGKGANWDREIARLAERQHGIVTLSQLYRLGLGEEAVRGRVRKGRLHRVYRGVYAVGHLALSTEGRWMAAVLACGRTKRDLYGHAPGTIIALWGAALSHRSAACHWGLLNTGDGPVDISVPGDGGRRSRDGIRLHRSLTLLPASVTLRSGIPVTSPKRTIADLRRVSSGKRRQISPWELRRAIRQASVLGLPLGDDAGDDRTRSDLERDFLLLCNRHRLPMPEVNVRIGSHVVDFLWRDQMLIVETDGYRYHRGRVAFEDDRARGLALRALGFEVLPLADRQINVEPERIARVLRARLAHFRSHAPETRQAAP